MRLWGRSWPDTVSIFYSLSHLPLYKKFIRYLPEDLQITSEGDYLKRAISVLLIVGFLGYIIGNFVVATSQSSVPTGCWEIYKHDVDDYVWNNGEGYWAGVRGYVLVYDGRCNYRNQHSRTRFRSVLEYGNKNYRRSLQGPHIKDCIHKIRISESHRRRKSWTT